MKTTFYNHLKAFTLCAGFFSLAACKEKSTVKPDLIPPVDNIHTFEVNDLLMGVKNSYYDSIWTSDNLYTIVSIGGITNDPFFGKTAAGAYMQFITPSAGFAFPAGYVIDSSVLSVPFSSFAYGDTTRTNTANVLKVKAYQITDPFAFGDGSTKYFSFSKIAYNTNALGSGTISIKSMLDSVTLSSGDVVAGTLRLKMNASLNALFQSMDPSFLSTNAAFLDHFRGIYLGPDTTQQQNTLASFTLNAGAVSNLNYANAQLEFYYHTATDTTRQKAFFRFDPAVCSFFNGITRNYNGYPVLKYLSNQAAARDSIVLQGYPGFRSDITINIDPAKIPPSVINKAELKMTILKTGDDDRFSASPQIIVRALDDAGKERTIADILNGDDSTTNSSGTIFVGGVATNTQIGASKYIQYTLNIPRELQKAISENRTQLKLRILIPTAYQGAYRMVADGPNSSNADTRLRFNVIYTKLN